MSRPALPCLVCKKGLVRVFDDAHQAQAEDGLFCETSGNYGSTFFDPMDGSELSFCVCDTCMKEACEAGRVVVDKSHRPVLCDGGVVGRQKVHRETVDWYPTAGQGDMEDVLRVEDTELGTDIEGVVWVKGVKKA
jgi:hypothetical protein